MRNLSIYLVRFGSLAFAILNRFMSILVCIRSDLPTFFKKTMVNVLLYMEVYMLKRLAVIIMFMSTHSNVLSTIKKLKINCVRWNPCPLWMFMLLDIRINTDKI